MNTISFQELAEVNPRVNLQKGKTYPFVEMGVVQPGLRYVGSNQTRSFKGGGAKFMSGDTLFARITPCLENGKIAQYISKHNKIGFGSTEFFVFRARPGLSDPGFVYYLSRSDIIRKPAEKSMTGASGRQRADLASIVNIPILHFPLTTQHKIAAILSAYDDLIENNLRRIKVLEEMAQNLYREWFVKFRFPGHEQARFVDSEMGRIPEGWKKPFTNCVDFKEGPGLRNWQYRKNGIPFLNIRTLIDNDIDFSKIQFLDPVEVNHKYKHFLLKENDHVVSSSGTLGRIVTIQKQHLPLMLNTSIIRMRPLNHMIGTWQLKHFLKSEYFQNQIHSLATGVAQANFGPMHLKQISIICSPKYLSEAYEFMVEPLELLISSIVQKNQILRKTRDLLLPRLISGEVDVSDLDISLPK